MKLGQRPGRPIRRFTAKPVKCEATVRFVTMHRKRGRCNSREEREAAQQRGAQSVGHATRDDYFERGSIRGELEYMAQAFSTATVAPLT